MSSQRLSLTMNILKFDRNADERAAPTDRAGRLALWIVLALGLLLMLVSTGKAEQGEARRTDRINGTLTGAQSLQVDNVSGDITASPGKQFSAVVSITVSAPSQKQADELLQNTQILQSHDEEGWSLETRWPGMHGRGDRGRGACSRCRVVANYEITVPPGVTAEFQTVNGSVSVRDLDGELKLESVNGEIDARGVRKSLEAQTVNGAIEAQMLSLGAQDSVELQSVNGSVTLTLPKDAHFDLSAETMNGTIESTFPLAVRPAHRGETPRTPKSSGGKSRQIVVTDDVGDTTVVDLDELDQEIADSMKDIEMEIEEGLREAEKEMGESHRELRKIRVMDPRRGYSGSIGKGGASVRIETLNGTVTVLAAGTTEAQAKPLVSERRSFVVTVPPARVRVPRVPAVPPVPGVPPVPPVPPLPPYDDDEGEPSIVRGNISGDFLSTSNGSYRIGDVTGRVKIVTHSGEIRVGSIGAGADLKTFGGDIILGPVTGDLKASTMAGDIRSIGVTGSALADTAGGDIRIERVGAALDAKTAGGDIVVGRVGGGLKASTAGGDVRIAVASSSIPGGIFIQSMGGDVSLSLPADCKADLELVVDGAEEDDLAIRSEFPNLTMTRRPGSQRATAKLNGGGERVLVKTSSGMIRLTKAASP